MTGAASGDFEAFRVSVYDVVAQILSGRVMAHSGGGLPWWRVVYADGHLLPGYEEQALDRYREEGTPLLPGGRRIDIRRASWSPDR